MPKPPVKNSTPQGTPSRWSGGDLGLHLIVSVVMLGAIGLGLDRHFGWTPWGMMLGGVLGFVSWFYVAWKTMGRKG